MQPLPKSSSQLRNPMDSLTNTPAYKCGWLNKRGMFNGVFVDTKISFLRSESRDIVLS